ncbi:MAG: DNA mismatch repair endonuclease MutL [Planctomycetes bacterium]|jgi:DNA mismatch repair protein MutL|nr:DNA mismatch repair endonuclease MutL [Planctomycetota bacterium]
MVNLIAAGEVIERPASVVKELVENSIDAGATKIVVTAEDGGRKLISVVDDGSGMDADDLATAFESHATSKIKQVEDLQQISTLGFRGEALASIASVARVRAVTRRRSSDQAHCLEIDCGARSPVRPCSGDFGTTIEVRDLFYKTPARRKFLRTGNTELGHISEQFARIALPQGHLDLILVHKGKELYRLPRTESLKERIGQLFPMLAGAPGDLIETQSDEKGIRIRAVLGRPSLSRTSNQFQYAFLNGRFIRDKFISHAIKEAYRGLLEGNRFPVVFLFLEMPFADYDVNVHPTKIEVRFYNSNLVHSQVLGVLREQLLGTDLRTPVRLPAAAPLGVDESPSGRQARRQEIADAMAEFFRKHRPAQQQHFDLRPDSGAGPRAPRPESPAAAPSRSETGTQLPDGRYLQIHDSYIVEQTADGFVVIDQHALHERMLYETLQRRLRRESLESQRLLLPESLEVTDAQAGAIESHAELLTQLGIELTAFGPRTYAVQTLPTLLGGVPPAEFVQDLVDLLVERGTAVAQQDLLNDILSMAACKAAIKAGQKLTDSEIQDLLAERRQFESTSRCPHGRPTTIHFSLRELEKQFKRT